MLSFRNFQYNNTTVSIEDKFLKLKNLLNHQGYLNKEIVVNKQGPTMRVEEIFSSYYENFKLVLDELKHHSVDVDPQTLMLDHKIFTKKSMEFLANASTDLNLKQEYLELILPNFNQSKK